MSTDIDDLLPGAPLLVTGRLVAVGVPESALRDLRERCEQQAAEIERLRVALQSAHATIRAAGLRALEAGDAIAAALAERK